ncbi:MAG: DUF3987 domain-containing protein, partial [Paludibacteraceae bacterium]|nr:DUF3987 domain-containing protein [Paludibacteraceae bacterium]
RDGRIVGFNEEKIKEAIRKVMTKDSDAIVLDDEMLCAIAYARSTQKVKNAKFSRYSGPIGNTKPEGDPVGLDYVYKMATSDEQLSRICNVLRCTTDKDTRDGIKTRLPYVTHGCVCECRSEKCVIETSNIFCVDFDNVLKPHELKQELLVDPYFETQLVMISPSGHGVKWFVYYPFMENKSIVDEMLQKDCSVAEVYKFTYECMANCFEHTYNGFYVDLNARDIARATFLSSDKGAYINPLLIGGEPNIYNCFKRKEFDIMRWCRSVTKVINVTPTTQTSNVVYTTTASSDYIWVDSDSDEAHVEALIDYLKVNHVDITSDYNYWLNIGFALVNSFGERGRKYFHDISQFYSTYSFSECEKKYSELLNSTRGNITIATLFKYFTDATGMKVATRKEEKQEMMVEKNNVDNKCLDLCFASEVNEYMPMFFKEINTLASTDRAKDVVLFSTSVVLGATMDRVKLWHYDKWVSPFLYFGVVAQSGAGKSVMDYSRKLLKDIEQENKRISTQRQNDYELRRKDGGRNFTEKRPSKKGLVIGGDLSDIALKRRLAANDEVGLIYEVEGEQLMATFNKTDWGLVSTTLKKAFDHEFVEANRGTDNETIELENPKIAILMSGTDDQFGPFVENYTTGLGSRFLWYDFDGKKAKHNVAGTGLNLGILDSLSKKVYEMHQMLAKRKEDLIVEFKDEARIERHNNFFDEDGYLGGRGGAFYEGLIQRSSSMAHRLMAIFTVVRAYEEGVDLLTVSSLKIADVDFE